jgi:pilus assembly protein FimV
VKIIRYFVLLCCLSLTAPSAFALGFGSSKLHSTLGRPLNISIELTNSDDLTIEDIQANKAPDTVFKRLGVDHKTYIPDLKISINEKAGKLFVLVTTSSPYNEPFFDTVIQVRWASGNINKQVTLLIDP